MIAAAVTARLRADGHRVEVAADGPGGVALCQRVRPDLALLDLPGPDGDCVLAHVLARVPDGGWSSADLSRARASAAVSCRVAPVSRWSARSCGDQPSPGRGRPSAGRPHRGQIEDDRTRARACSRTYPTAGSPRWRPTRSTASALNASRDAAGTEGRYAGRTWLRSHAATPSAEPRSRR